MPTPLGLYQELWGDDIRFVTTARDGGHSEPDVRRAAMLLDRIGWEAAAPAAHILDDSYEHVFSTDELQMRDRLRELARAAQAPEEPEVVRRGDLTCPRLLPRVPLGTSTASQARLVRSPPVTNR